jgi:hypothetical protein
VLDDAHPDHSALRVMLELALQQIDIRCVRLGYRVHGKSPSRALRVIADATAQARKLDAMEAYASQLALSRRRLVALSERAEVFEAESRGPVLQGNPASIAIPFCAPRARVLPRELLLVLVTRHGVLRFRQILPRAPARIVLVDAHGHRIEAEARAGMLLLDLPADARPLLAAWAKCERGHPRIVVYDRECWRAAPRAELAAVAAAPAAIGPGQA